MCDTANPADSPENDQRLVGVRDHRTCYWFISRAVRRVGSVAYPLRKPWGENDQIERVVLKGNVAFDVRAVHPNARYSYARGAHFRSQSRLSVPFMGCVEVLLIAFLKVDPVYRDTAKHPDIKDNEKLIDILSPVRDAVTVAKSMVR